MVQKVKIEVAESDEKGFPGKLKLAIVWCGLGVWVLLNFSFNSKKLLSTVLRKKKRKRRMNKRENLVFQKENSIKNTTIIAAYLRLIQKLYRLLKNIIRMFAYLFNYRHDYTISPSATDSSFSFYCNTFIFCHLVILLLYFIYYTQGRKHFLLRNLMLLGSERGLYFIDRK